MGGAGRGLVAVAATGLVLGLAGCADTPVTVPERPAGSSVLDAAEVLTEAQERELDALIEDRNAGTDGARVAVLVVPEAEGSVEDYAREVATAWEVGDRGADNGVLVLAATEDRELRIEVADGVRERFSDDEAQDVVDDALAPAFRDERYAQGLAEAVEQVYVYADGGEPAREPFDRVLLAVVIGAVVLAAALVVVWVVADGRRRRRIADEEIRAAEDRDPRLRLTEEQRTAYRAYRHAHRKDDAVADPSLWLPLYLANPALYSGGGSESSGGSSTSGGTSFGGGGGFSGGGASGGY